MDSGIEGNRVVFENRVFNIIIPCDQGSWSDIAGVVQEDNFSGAI